MSTKLNFIKNIKRRIHSWNEYKNPLYYWWKARKVFKRPKIHFVYGEFNGYFGLRCQTDYYKYPRFQMAGLGWKDKFNEPRHEWDPCIAFTWPSPFKTTYKSEKFGTFKRRKIFWIALIFNYCNKKDGDSYTRNIATWEAILDYLYYKKDTKDLVDNHKWLHGVRDNEYEITIDKNLK